MTTSESGKPDLVRPEPPTRSALADHQPIAPADGAGRPRREMSLPLAIGVELAIAAAVFGLYRAGRLLTRDSTREAARNARRVIDFERAVGLFTEQNLQRWLLPLEGVIAFLNRYYVFLHFPVTVSFLVWVFVYRHDHYARIRNWFAAVTLLALVIHIVFPLAPPRMIPGFVDTLRAFGPQIYTADTTESLANQFAAMPSLHFGWALMVGLGLRRLLQRSSLVWLVHPMITLVAIVVTGNHYWTDALVAGALALILAKILYPAGRAARASGRLATLGQPATGDRSYEPQNPATG